MNSNDLVSIIVPVFNMGNKIEACVNSLMAQTYDNIEIILIDDGSSDNSYDECTRIADRDARIKTFHTENRGSGPARNCGIEHSNGKFLYFPDADDFLDPNAIGILVNSINTSKADLLVFGFRTLHTSRKVISAKIYEDIIIDGIEARRNYSDYASMSRPYCIQGAPWNKFFKREIIEKYGIVYPPLRRHQDEAFISRYVTYVQKIQFISPVLYSYFANDLYREWDKYPITYIDAVIGLYNDRKQNMLIWCETDKESHDRIHAGYISGVIKALELSFSPKFQFNRVERMDWIKQSIQKSQILVVPRTNHLGKYQRYMLGLISNNSLKKLYALLRLKVWIEKNGLLRILKIYF